MHNTGTALAIGGVTGLSVFIAEMIGFGKADFQTVLPVFTGVGTLAWMIGRRFQALEDRAKINHEAIIAHSKVIEDHTKAILTLPCYERPAVVCEEVKPKAHKK